MNNHSINFDIDYDPICCGIYHLGNFSQGSSLFNNNNKELSVQKEKEIFKTFEEDWRGRFYDCVRNDGWHKGGQYTITASLVKKYSGTGVHQFPELATHFKKNKWKVTNTFKNNNTGNIVEVFQKRITNKELKKMKSEFGKKERDTYDNW